MELFAKALESDQGLSAQSFLIGGRQRRRGIAESVRALGHGN